MSSHPDTPSPNIHTAEEMKAKTQTVIEPSVDREAIESDGEVGAVAYPYRVYRGTAAISRTFLADRIEEYIVTVDQSRRLALRADTYPNTERKRISDLLLLPVEVTPDQCREMAREAIFKWTLRTCSLNASPDIDIFDPESVYKLFWLVERDGKELIIDSVDGTERQLRD